MSLRDVIEAQRGRSDTGQRCGIEQLLNAMDDDARTELVELLGDWSVPGSAIAFALKTQAEEFPAPLQRVYGVGGAAIRRHRRNECRCEESK